MAIVEILTSKILLSCLAAVIMSQLIKIAVASIKKGNLDLSSFLVTGGMPSSHSAVVSALATSLFIIEGTSTLFFVSVILAFIVIYDSVTIRKVVGIHTELLNDLLKSLKIKKHEKIEFQGHSLTQALAGVILGIVVALLICNLY